MADWFTANAPPNPSGIVRQPTGDFGTVHADSDPIQSNGYLPPEIQTWGQYREALKTQPWLGSSEGPGGFSGHAQDGGGLSGSMSDWLGGGMTDTGGGTPPGYANPLPPGTPFVGQGTPEPYKGDPLGASHYYDVQIFGPNFETNPDYIQAKNTTRQLAVQPQGGNATLPGTPMNDGSISPTPAINTSGGAADYVKFLSTLPNMGNGMSQQQLDAAWLQANPGNPMYHTANGGGGIVRQPTSTLQNGGSPTGGIPGALGSGNAILPGTPTNGGNPTPVFPGVGGSGNAQMFPTGGSSTTAPATGGAASIVSQVANSIGRPDLANNPYWIDFYNKNPDANYLKEKMSKPDDGTGSTGSSAGGSLGAFLQPFTGTFQAPTGTDDPGFQFAVGQGQDAIQRSAAAKGNLLTGGTLKDLASYTTGAALQDYSGAYNRALSTFGTNYDIFRNNQTDPYNKLLGVTNVGLNATNAQTAAGSSYGNNLTSLSNNFGNTQQNNTTGVGNAQAAGTIGAANALTPAIGALAPAFTSLGDWFKKHGGGSSGANYGWPSTPNENGD